MFTYSAFSALKIGQRVKIKCEPVDGNTLNALEISYKEPKDQLEMEGKIQSLDAKNNVIGLLNQTFSIPPGIPVKNEHRENTELSKLAVGDMAKLIGHRSTDGEFIPVKLKTWKPIGVENDELQGNIESISSDEQILKLMNYNIIVNEATEYKGF
ncbi:MAG: hypothetical protein R3C26_22720 [Calditrichia bacterium]